MNATFLYTARTYDGRKISGQILAETRERALERLNGQRLAVLDIRTADTAKRLSFFAPKFRFEELILFSRQLATYQRTGIPITRALGIIKIGSPSGEFHLALENVRQQVFEGRPLSEAMDEHPRIFSEVYISAIAAGETSGQLAPILEETAEVLEKEMLLRRQVRSALRYPLFVIGAIFVAFSILMFFVIPRFVTFYAKFNADLPGPTRAMIATSEFITQYWPLVLTGLIGLGAAVRFFYRSPRGRFLWDGALLRIPIFGDLIIKGSVARFSLLFMIMIRAGIPIVRSLTTLRTSIKNVVLQKEIATLRDAFESGQELDPDGANLPVFPDMAKNMIKAGLETGSLEKMLGELGAHYTREVEYTSRNLAALIEPILTLFIGVMVLLLALAIFLPMWNLVKVVH